ncbi:MAG: replication-associated recombination protein A, partial [candidate division Zixibacteria bacterium]|nr:replication-associated recombination protein A [candidate division Zixibacteria bacterium]
KDYKYAHEYKDAVTDQQYFPDELKGREYYSPKDVGRESRLLEYLNKYKALRKKLAEEK